MRNEGMDGSRRDWIEVWGVGVERSGVDYMEWVGWSGVMWSGVEGESLG